MRLPLVRQNQTATDRIEVDRLKKLFENWRMAAIVLATILALIAASWIF
jgi:hypothetical protein